MTPPRGFTLAELMVALVLTMMVGGVTYQLLMNNQRLTRTQHEQVSMQDNARAGATIIGTELREVGYDRLPIAANFPPALQGSGLFASAGLVRSDLVAIGPDSVRYKAMRGFALTCGLDGGNSRLVLEAATFSTITTLAVGDSLLVYVEGNASTSADDIWLHGAMTSLPVNQACANGTAGRAIGIAFADGVTVAAAFGLMAVGAPVRFFEEMVLRSYQAGGNSWLGMRSVVPGGPIEPVLGPLANGTIADGTAGLGFQWLDAGGAATAVPANVRGVRVTLQSITGTPVYASSQRHALVDTLPLTTEVALRNALR